MQLISTNQLGREDNTTIVAYGLSGTGKTYAISTIEEPCLILSAEAGLRSLADFDFPAVEIEHPGQLMDILKWLASSKEAEQYTWVCLDSISEIAEQILIVEKRANKDGRKAYGEMAVKVTEVIRGFRDLKKCVYMTAKLDRVKDDFSGGLVCAPDMPGQRMRGQLPYLWTTCLHCRRRRIPRERFVDFFKHRAMRSLSPRPGEASSSSLCRRT